MSPTIHGGRSDETIFQDILDHDDGAGRGIDGRQRRLRPETTTPAAASPTPDDTQEVVVTGFRQSIEHAEDLKRKAVGAEDVILAQDIASFPDLNLAESLQRVPGITISRDSGEGRQITLRGLGPDFTRTQLNGMEVLGNTASGMDNRGGVSRTRAFDYSLFASELFDKVVVQKSYSADQDEGSIGGTVQLYTARPFDYPGFKGVLSVQAQDNVDTDKGTPRVVALLSNRWGDFGALVSVAYSKDDSNEYGYRNYGWGPIYFGAANIGPGVSAADAARLTTQGPNEILAPQADTYSTWLDRRSRLGTTVSMQYEPGTKLKLGFDALFSQLKNNRDDYSLTTSGTNSLTGNVTGTQVLQSDTIKGNALVAASYTGVDLRSEANVEEDTTNFYQTDLHGSYEVNDQLWVTGLVGYSRSDYSLPVFDKVFLESKNHPFSFNDLTDSPSNTYGFNTTNPALWNLMRMDTQENYISSRYTNAKFDAFYALNGSSTFQAGVEYKKFVNSGSQYNDKEFHNPGNVDTVIPDNLKSTVPYDTLGNYTVGDLNQIYALIGQNRNIRSIQYAAPGTAYVVTEQTASIYLQYDLDTNLWGHRVRANAGGRYYTTDLTSAGSLNTGTTLSPRRHQAHLWRLPAGRQRGGGRDPEPGGPGQRQPRHQPSGPGQPRGGRVSDHRALRRHPQRRQPRPEALPRRRSGRLAGILRPPHRLLLGGRLLQVHGVLHHHDHHHRALFGHGVSPVLPAAGPGRLGEL